MKVMAQQPYVYDAVVAADHHRRFDSTPECCKNLTAHQHARMDIREFAVEVKRRGFGKPDVLAELYDPDTRKLVEVS